MSSEERNLEVSRGEFARCKAISIRTRSVEEATIRQPLISVTRWLLRSFRDNSQSQGWFPRFEISLMVEPADRLWIISSGRRVHEASRSFPLLVPARADRTSIYTRRGPPIKQLPLNCFRPNNLLFTWDPEKCFQLLYQLSPRRGSATFALGAGHSPKSGSRISADRNSLWPPARGDERSFRDNDTLATEGRTKSYEGNFRERKPVAL